MQVSQVQPMMYSISDVIKQNESELANIDFEIKLIKGIPPDVE